MLALQGYFSWHGVNCQGDRWPNTAWSLRQCFEMLMTPDWCWALKLENSVTSPAGGVTAQIKNHVYRQKTATEKKRRRKWTDQATVTQWNTFMLHRTKNKNKNHLSSIHTHTNIFKYSHLVFKSSFVQKWSEDCHEKCLNRVWIHRFTLYLLVLIKISSRRNSCFTHFWHEINSWKHWHFVSLFY